MSISYVVLAVIAFYAGLRFRFWYREGQKMLNAGYIPPTPTWVARLSAKVISRLVTWPTVGRLKVIGRENIPKNGRRLLLGNHTFDLDVFLTSRGFGISYRQLGKLAEVTGWRSVFAAWQGLVAVDVDKGKAKNRQAAVKAIRAYTDIIASSPDSCLMAYPQGTVLYDGNMEPDTFRDGPIRGMQKASAEVGVEGMTVTPFAIYYNNSSDYIDNALKRLFSRRGGATLVIGKPIPFENLPADSKDATEYIRQEILRLLDVAKGKVRLN